MKTRVGLKYFVNDRRLPIKKSESYSTISLDKTNESFTVYWKDNSVVTVDK